MSDVEDWIRVHDEELAQIATTVHLEASVVHLVAVLVYAGVEDAQIFDQLDHLLPSIDGPPHSLAGAARAVEEIRRLAATT